ncbi:putative B3 domain-containing protein [Camellia lanceoleosa]|nr:putative B3 domain-containing protein [Camellia lanceoleosa]
MGKNHSTEGLGVGKEIKIRWANKCLHFSVPQEQNSAAVVLDQWPIKKALTLSDVDTNHPFLTLPGKSVEDHILLHWPQQTREKLRNERQLNINAQDFDTGDLYAMKLRWRGSYYNLIGKWGKIIRGKRLSVGKEIRVCWDNGFLLFSVHNNICTNDEDVSPKDILHFLKPFLVETNPCGCIQTSANHVHQASSRMNLVAELLPQRPSQLDYQRGFLILKGDYSHDKAWISVLLKPN